MSFTGGEIFEIIQKRKWGKNKIYMTHSRHATEPRLYATLDTAPLLRPLAQKPLRGHAPDWNLSPLHAQNVILNKNYVDNENCPPTSFLGSLQVNKGLQYCEKDK